MTAAATTQSSNKNTWACSRILRTVTVRCGRSAAKGGVVVATHFNCCFLSLRVLDGCQQSMPSIDIGNAEPGKPSMHCQEAAEVPQQGLMRSKSGTSKTSQRSSWHVVLTVPDVSIFCMRSLYSSSTANIQVQLPSCGRLKSHFEST